MDKEKLPLVILTGPTAVGKTRLSVELAKAIGGEIISADSMQVYKGMDIGSAKVTREEMQGVPHFLLDELEPWEEFHVVKFQEYAKRHIGEICARGHIPVLAGGTGFYIQAVLYGIDFTENGSDQNLRRELEERAKEEGGVRALHEELARVDPASAETIHEHNVKRVIRALEYYRATGARISEHNAAERKKESPYRFAYFVLNEERAVLYDRIDRRVDEMLAAGLLDEVRTLREKGCTRGLPSMQGLGYKEMLAYLDGEYSFDEAVYRIRQNTRHFAKRQLTWFRRERDVIWVEKERYGGDDGQILAFLLDELRRKGILN